MSAGSAIARILLESALHQVRRLPSADEDHGCPADQEMGKATRLALKSAKKRRKEAKAAH